MGVEALDSYLDFGGDVLGGGAEGPKLKFVDIDVRRRLEDKLEDIRLLREVQEFDFDF